MRNSLHQFLEDTKPNEKHGKEFRRLDPYGQIQDYKFELVVKLGYAVDDRNKGWDDRWKQLTEGTYKLAVDLYAKHRDEILRYLGKERAESIRTSSFAKIERGWEMFFFEDNNWTLEDKVAILQTFAVMEDWLRGYNISAKDFPVYRLSQWAPREIDSFVEGRVSNASQDIASLCEEYLESIKLKLLNATSEFSDGDGDVVREEIRALEVLYLPRLMLWRRVLEYKDLNDKGRSQLSQ